MIFQKAIILASVAIFSTATAATVPAGRSVEFAERSAPDNALTKRGREYHNLGDQRPLPKGVEDFPTGNGANLCLCNNDNFNQCLCVKDMQGQGYFDVCLSNSNGGPKWGGFDNDAITGMSLTGPLKFQCTFFDLDNCRDGALFSESSATQDVKIPNLGKDHVKKISSFYCTFPTVRRPFSFLNILVSTDGYFRTSLLEHNSTFQYSHCGICDAVDSLSKQCFLTWVQSRTRGSQHCRFQRLGENSSFVCLEDNKWYVAWTSD